MSEDDWSFIPGLRLYDRRKLNERCNQKIMASLYASRMIKRFSKYACAAIWLSFCQVGVGAAEDGLSIDGKAPAHIENPIGDLNAQTKCAFANQAIDEKRNADVSRAAGYMALSVILSDNAKLLDKLNEDIAQKFFQLSFDNCKAHPDDTIQSQAAKAILSLKDKIKSAD